VKNTMTPGGIIRRNGEKRPKPEAKRDAELRTDSAQKSPSPAAPWLRTLADELVKKGIH